MENITYYQLLITHEKREVRRSWRVGADCKSVASLLSRFESCYFHQTADNVMAACRKCTLVVQVRLLVRWSKKSEWWIVNCQFKKMTVKKLTINNSQQKRSIRLTVQDACLSSRKQGFDSLIEYRKVKRWMVNFAPQVNLRIDYEINWRLTIHKEIG